MWPKTKPFIKAALLIAVVLLIAGCTGQKCEGDSDCGQGYCSDDQRTMISPTCVDGNCSNISTECSETEICVAGELGASCLPMDPDTSKAIISCSNPKINPYVPDFDQTVFVCFDDCPGDYFCTDSCYCEKKVEISCIENTDYNETEGENIFDRKTEMCGDDCPGGYDCNAECICEERPRPPCPEPEFEVNSPNEAPHIDYDVKTLTSLWLDDPGNLLELEPTIRITAYAHYRNGVWHYLPFPEVQLELIPNNEYLEQYGAYCVNDYYDGIEALDIQREWLKKPEETCIWGGTEGFEGVLTVCPEYIMDWMLTYSTNINLLFEW